MVSVVNRDKLCTTTECRHSSCLAVVEVIEEVVYLYLTKPASSCLSIASDFSRL